LSWRTLMTAAVLRPPTRVTTYSVVVDRWYRLDCPVLRWVLTPDGLRMRWSLPRSYLER